MIRGIVFDCFGVLYGGSYQALRSMCPVDKLDDLRDLNHQADYGFISTDDYIHGCAELLDKTVSEVATLFRTKHVRNDALLEYARGLKGDYRLGLLSNVSNGVIEQLFAAADLELFDEVVLSYKEHIAKPNPAAFMLAASELGLPTGECVMIDDLAENCEGAEVAGMAAIIHTSNEVTIDSLSKLLSR
jgi:putative hydrolase of the HAD superfamily